MRALRRALRRVILFLGLAALLYCTAATLGAVIPGARAEIAENAAGRVEIGLIAGPIHVDFLLPATQETRGALQPAQAAGVPVNAPAARHFLVGWGAREFYTTAGTYADIEWPALRRAITGDASVVRVDAVGALPPDFPMQRLRLTQTQYAALLAAIERTFAGDALANAGFTPTDGFVEARGRFDLFRTCNTWISAMLRDAGHTFGIWTPTPFSVRLSAWWYGR